MGARLIINSNTGWNSGTLDDNCVAEGGKLKLAKNVLKPLPTYTSIPSWNTKMYALRKNGSIVEVPNSHSYTYYAGNFKGGINFPLLSGVVVKKPIVTGTNKIAIENDLPHDETYVQISPYCAHATKGASIKNIKLYFKDGWSGTIQQAATNQYIDSVVFRHQEDNVAAVGMWDTSTIFTGGTTGIKNYSFVHILLRPLSKARLTHFELNTNKDWNSNDDIRIQKTEIIRIQDNNDFFNYAASATWIAPPLSLDVITDASDSLITRAATLPAGTSAKVYTGINEDSENPPINWTEQVSGQAISQITPGNDYSGKYLWTKIVLATADAAETPEVSALSLTVGQHFRRFPAVHSRKITVVAVRNAIVSAICIMKKVVARTTKTFGLHRAAVTFTRPIKAIAGRLVLLVFERVWIPLGVFWSGDWHAPEDAVYAKTTGRDRLELLRMTDYTAGEVAPNLSLYDFAADVLQDAGLAPGDYWIDDELQDYVIPYAWAEPQSHREILRKIAEACLGQVYCDRDGVLRIEGPSFLAAKSESELTITTDDYFKKDNPVKWSEIANWIEVETQPLLPEELQEIYRDNEPQEIEAGGSIEMTVKFNNGPCINPAARLDGADEGSNPPAGCVIDQVTFYAWGADVRVTSPQVAGAFVLVIEGQPLKVMNQQLIVAKDEDSIREHGVVQYTFPANPYIQTAAIARRIASQLLESFKDPRRDLDMTWRGNPALELADRITVPDYKETGLADFHVTQQELSYAGGLRCTLKGRRAAAQEDEEGE